MSNGTCSNQFGISDILLDNQLQASFESTSDLCPEDPARCIDHSFNHIISWNWNFGNGTISNSPDPPPQYYVTNNRNLVVPVKLTVTNYIGCTASAVNYINILANCYIAVPSAFTPNGDGLNDYLYPTNAYKAVNLTFCVYNRAGQKLFETSDWTKKWDGTFNGQPQDPGTYVWTLVYTNVDTGKKVAQKGSTVLIR